MLNRKGKFSFTSQYEIQNLKYEISPVITFAVIPAMITLSLLSQFTKIGKFRLSLPSELLQHNVCCIHKRM